MNINADKVVSFHFTLTNTAGQKIESSLGAEPLTYLHGHNAIVPGLEEALEGRKKGDQLNVTLPPEKAYGQRNEKLVQKVPKNQFPETPQVGMQFQTNTPQGRMIITVTAVTETEVTVDANHEMAGQTLVFDLEVVDVREATEEELAHGHVHGPGGHHHG